ncbi:antigen 5 like allergen Cul n 1-like [Malaya genurostris]|uniref:antigen 5 like allergen Cul n 1-like n=1 Tax=Malaya genurostris TaxID=325434 RepID=UPI0026F3F56B|nr:antigen 5 like allergen Cul n 1-like [Malaya genurostris]
MRSNSSKNSFEKFQKFKTNFNCSCFLLTEPTMSPDPFILLLIALALNVGYTSEATSDDNYCRKETCPGGKIHIGCDCSSKAKLSYGPQCTGKNPRKITVDKKMRSLILRKHNSQRNSIACGQITPYPPAARMFEVLWDNDLEHLAWCNARRCVYGHDQCRNTKKYPSAGQNIASKTACKTVQLEPEDIIVSSIETWFLEHRNATPAMVERYPGKIRNGPIGHFTVLVNDRVRRIGCSLIVYDARVRAGSKKTCQTHYLVCNYSSTNFMLEPTYVKSQSPAQNCDGLSKQYSCLCAATAKSLRRRKHAANDANE